SGQERFADSPNRRGPRSRGLNENYARELLELHTLGVDGGYSQQDVVEVARAFTGWTLVPAAREAQLDRRLDRARRAGGLGFVVEGDFLFRADAHDAGSKQVLGTRLPAGRGLEDGEQVLDLVARHLATARHLARKLAIRFVSDEPPGLLVERLAKTFSASGGDLRAVIRALVESPEFWAPEARRAKIKSPFELAASALRATGAEVSDPVETIEWIGRMGQPLYLYQAPTGFPEVAEHWVSTGALLSRMNFGLALAAGRVGGVRLELATLVGEREPESREEALDLLLPLLLPERETAALRPQLAAAVRESGLARKVAERSEQAGGASAMEDYGSLEEDPVFSQLEPGRDSPYGRLFQRHRRAAGVEHEPTAVEQVVGVILGSPEFQRR
ncbi:MAG TPA: DUF1800 domain-containing protein, partial [Thermoanaerobaculia bacterium]|nr:DUF1800 domain-containing protein [Thermoanaerobaculia bacterium]